MPQKNDWVPPQNKEIINAFHYVDDGVHAVGKDAPKKAALAHGQASLDVWNVAQALPDAAFMILKSADHQSLAFRNGGIVVEGAHKLNAGLLRSSTKALEEAPMPLQEPQELETSDRFRRSFWAVMMRLSGAVIPRTMEFNLAGTKGTIHASNDKISLAGDFETIGDFVAEVRAASQIDDIISYSLIEKTSKKGSAEYPIDAMLNEVVAASEDGVCTFDEDSWPTARSDQAKFSHLQLMHDCLSAMKKHPAHSGEISISVLSQTNMPLLKGTVSTNGSAHFHLS